MTESPSHKRILVVDDGEKDAGIEELLRKTDFEVVHEEDLPPADNLPDAVDAVVCLPGSRRGDWYAEWTEAGALKVPVILCLGEAAWPERERFLRAGAQDCLPIADCSEESLRRSVEASIERHAVRARMAEQTSDRRLRDSEALYHSLVESLTQNIIRKDVEGRFTFANSNFCKTIAKSLEEIIGKTDADLFSASLAKKYQEDDRRVMDTRVPLEAEEAHKTSDGQTLVVKVVKTPIFDSSGRVIGTQGIFWDITEQKRAQIDLAASQERFELAVRGTADGIWDWDVLTNDVYFSDRFKELLGYGPDEFGNDFEAWATTLHPEDRAATLEAFDAHLENRVPYDVEYRLRRKDGYYGWYRARGLAIWGSSGKATRMAGSISDISDRKRAEKALRARTVELEKSNRDLEQFAYIASHDLKEPLRMVSSYVGLLERRYGDSLDNDAKEFIQYAVEGSARMKALIDDLLVFSRVGTKGKDLVATDSLEAVHAALSNLDPVIKETEAEVSVEGDTLPRVIGDQVQLTQLFQNLVGNAIKFTKDRTPWIEIKGHQEKGSRFCKFSVRDNGIGIDSAHTERIFQIFQRLNERSEYEGTGIGLAVARKIVDRHGGTIAVDSAIGEGSTFSFTIPVASGTSTTMLS